MKKICADYLKLMIIQSYNTRFSGGIGDFIRGSIYLHRNCTTDFFVDFKHHPIREWIDNKNESKEIYQEKEIINFDICSKEIKNKIQRISNSNKKFIISSYYFDLFENKDNLEKIKEIKLSEQEKIFFKNCFGFNKIEEKYQNFIKINEVNEKLKVFHFRLGDIELLNNESSNLKSKILNKKKYDYEYLYNKLPQNEKIIVLSDSNNFKKFLENKNKNIIMPKTKSNHTVFKPGILKFHKKNIDVKNMSDLVLDLKILSEAGELTSYSSNWWGSGFSFWICKIYDIPINMNFL